MSVSMDKKRLPPSLDAALSQVNPERRRLLGMMLAGAAALPLLTSTPLAAEDKPADKSTDKSAIKHGPLDYKEDPKALKSDLYVKGQPSQIKSNTNSKTMTWTKGGVTANDSTQIKADTRVKTSAPIKSAIELKTQSAPIKSGAAPVKTNNTPQ